MNEAQLKRLKENPVIRERFQFKICHILSGLFLFRRRIMVLTTLTDGLPKLLAVLFVYPPIFLLQLK
jgi:hypothetical protein